MIQTLRIFNTASGQLEALKPIDPQQVGIYVCGPTVYDRIHIGNARPLVVFDLLVRVLRRLYSQVTYVRNITDVDDKIIARARERSVDATVLTREATAWFHEDAAALGCAVPDIEPRATEHITEMLDLIEALINQGSAYQVGTDVFFSIDSFPDYGKLARKDRDSLRAGARVDVQLTKRDPADFTLWKSAPDDEPGWPSPYGRGRPGWHMECSAMSQHYLGRDFDIHGGGIDLIFPHHQNELAQSVCAHPGTKFAHFWVHNGHVTCSGEKMSKSLGNMEWVKDLLDIASGPELRLALLKTHYRAPLEFTRDRLIEAKAELRRFHTTWRRLQREESRPDPNDQPVPTALLEDLNVPQALFDLHRIANAVENGETLPTDARNAFRASLDLLGLIPTGTVELSLDNTRRQSIEARIAERNQARQNRNFARADHIRHELEQEGIILEDSGNHGTRWRILS